MINIKHWLSQNKELEVLSELGTIQVKPSLGIYTLTKEMGKFSITILQPKHFIELFSLPLNLKHGSAIFYLKEEEQTPKVTLNYNLSFSSSVLNSTNFIKFISEVKDELHRIEDLVKEVNFIETSLINYSKMLSGNKSQSKESQTPTGFSITSIEKFLNNLDNNEDENNSK